MPFYLLPVSPGQRKLWTPTKPRGITNSNSDHVSYLAKGGREPIDLDGTACYSMMMREFKRYEIHCRPKQKPKAISLDDAFSFFSIMTDYGVIPENVKLWEEKDGVHCQIPKGAGSNHNIYATLTCYRWVDAHPPLVWEFLRIWEQDTERHPLQILPYLIQRHVKNCNHSFITVGGWRMKYQNYESALNPTLGLAAKIYFDPKDKRGQASQRNNGHTNEEVGKISKSISPKKRVRNPNTWGPDYVDTPKYQLKDPADGLHPDLHPLYKIPNITTAQVDEILSRLFTEESK